MSELRIEAQAVVEIGSAPPAAEACDPLEWGRYNAYNLSDDHFDLLEPSKFARPSPELAVLHGRSPTWKSRPAIR